MRISLRHPSRVALISLATLLLAACADEEKTKQAAPGSQNPPEPDSRRAALDKAIGSDPGLTQPPVRSMLLAACMHPQAGKAIMDSAGTTVSGLLKTFVQPWLRPLFMAAADQAIQDRSRALKALRSGSAQSFHYNVVIVGAGPNGVLAAYHLNQANPGLKVAILDGEELPGQVFRTFGRFSWINSPETPAFSTNEFVGLPVAARDLLEPGSIQGGPTFVMPTVIADLTELTALESGADLWQGTEVNRIRQGGQQGLVLETTDPGLSLSADRVLVTTGLGRIPALIGDPDLPQPMENFNHLTARATRMVLRNRTRAARARSSFMAPYAGRRIAIIGAGDSANTLAEFAAGFAPPELYGLEAARPQPGTRQGPGIGEPGGPVSVLWVNQGHQDAASFQQGNKARYHGTLATAFGQFTATPLRLEAQGPEPGGGVDLTLRDPATGALSHQHVDFAWSATGYEVSSSPLIRHLVEDHLGGAATEAAMRHYLENLAPVRGPITVTAPAHKGLVLDTIIGRNLPPGDPLVETYLGGTAAGQLATAHELQNYTVTRNGHSLNANLPRAAALGRHLAALTGYQAAQVPPLPSAVPLEPLEPGTEPSSVRFLFNRRRREPFGPALTDRPTAPVRRKAFTEMALETLLARRLRGYSSSTDFTVQVEYQGPGAIAGEVRARLTLTRLDAVQAARLAQGLENDGDFMMLALDQAARQRTGPKTIGIQVRGTGPIEPDRMRVVYSK